MTTATDNDTKTRRGKVLPPVRVTDDERAAIIERATTAGLSASEFQRRMCLEGRIIARSRRSAGSGDPEALRLLLKVGNNLNQLTKTGHISGQVNLKALHDTLAEVRAAVAKIVP